jgi:hypothetical protein
MGAKPLAREAVRAGGAGLGLLVVQGGVGGAIVAAVGRGAVRRVGAPQQAGQRPAQLAARRRGAWRVLLLLAIASAIYLHPLNCLVNMLRTEPCPWPTKATTKL